MIIGRNLRGLRREKDMTQEELADILGVSFQAVSKWERGDSYPDITMLPGIASFFGVSVDALLGMDEIRKAEELAALKKKAWQQHQAGDLEAAAAILREGLKTYPNNDDLMLELSNFLINYRLREDVSQEAAREAITVYERILQYSVDAITRNKAQSSLPYAYFLAGDGDKAVLEVNKLPSVRESREFTLSLVTRGEEQIKALQSLLFEYCYIIWQKTRFAAPWDTYVVETDGDVFGYTAQERIKILEKGIKALELLADDGDYPIYPNRIAFNYRAMAVLALSDQQPEQAMDFLEKALAYAVMNDCLPEQYTPSSLLLNRFGGGLQEHLPGCGMLLVFLEQDLFEPLRKNDRFHSIMARLSQHAADSPTPWSR
jgi:transcriptional regulator with XRE-family HTH domain